MNDYNNMTKIAELSETEVARINEFQSKLRTLNDKDIILVAYEK
ncbi:MAG: hypothetical protein K0Q48_1326 [Bacillota bacterium]|jgi:hypothetical protein|nr:hypothetical protein [Bacillota bacterium]